MIVTGAVFPVSKIYINERLLYVPVQFSIILRRENFISKYDAEVRIRVRSVVYFPPPPPPLPFSSERLTRRISGPNLCSGGGAACARLSHYASVAASFVKFHISKPPLPSRCCCCRVEETQLSHYRVRELPDVTSAIFSDFLTPFPPLSAFGSDLYYKIHTTMSAFP